jgi:hypothetical protein
MSMERVRVNIYVVRVKFLGRHNSNIYIYIYEEALPIQMFHIS